MKIFDNTTTSHDFHNAHSCEQSLARLLPSALDTLLRAEFSTLRSERPHMFHLAMMEAAALATQTGFSQLFLPSLALEKAQLLDAWNRRQRAIRADHVPLALAA